MLGRLNNSKGTEIARVNSNDQNATWIHRLITRDELARFMIKVNSRDKDLPAWPGSPY